MQSYVSVNRSSMRENLLKRNIYNSKQQERKIKRDKDCGKKSAMSQIKVSKKRSSITTAVHRPRMVMRSSAHTFSKQHLLIRQAQYDSSKPALGLHAAANNAVRQGSN